MSFSFLLLVYRQVSALGGGCGPSGRVGDGAAVWGPGRQAALGPWDSSSRPPPSVSRIGGHTGRERAVGSCYPLRCLLFSCPRPAVSPAEPLVLQVEVGDLPLQEAWGLGGPPGESWGAVEEVGSVLTKLWV